MRWHWPPRPASPLSISSTLASSGSGSELRVSLPVSCCANICSYKRLPIGGGGPRGSGFARGAIFIVGQCCGRRDNRERDTADSSNNTSWYCPPSRRRGKDPTSRLALTLRESPALPLVLLIVKTSGEPIRRLHSAAKSHDVAPLAVPATYIRDLHSSRCRGFLHPELLHAVALATTTCFSLIHLISLKICCMHERYLWR